MSSTPKPVAPMPIVDQPFVQTHSAHNVRKWIRERRKEGKFKNCSHLGLKIVETTTEARFAGEPEEHDTYFVPDCGRRSFRSNFGHLDDEKQMGVMRFGLDQMPVECPKDCTFYENHRIGWLKKRTKGLAGDAYKSAAGLLKGLAALPWQTQVALTVLVIFLFTPRWVPLLTQLVRAITGKP